MRFWPQRWSKPAVIVSIVATASLLLLGVVASPYTLRFLAGNRTDWPLLSDVGEAYGGASALLSGLALAGITGSLILQRRQARIALLAAVRERHFSLAAMTIDRPELVSVVAPGSDISAPNRIVYANLNLSHFFMTWQLGLMSDARVVRLCSFMFANADIRRWWSTSGHDWTDPASRANRRFVALVHRGFDSASQIAPPPPAAEEPAVPPRRPAGDRRPSTLVITGAVAGSMVTVAAMFVKHRVQGPARSR